MTYQRGTYHQNGSNGTELCLDLMILDGCIQILQWKTANDRATSEYFLRVPAESKRRDLESIRWVLSSTNALVLDPQDPRRKPCLIGA